MARLDLETTLYGRATGLLHFVFQRGVDPATGEPFATDQPIAPTGSTAIYSDPIAFALGCAGVAMGNAFNPSDADLANVPGKSAGMVADLAEYRLILSTLGSFTDVTESEQDRSASYGQLADRFYKRAGDIEKRYASALNPVRTGGMRGGLIRDVPPTACRPGWAPGYRGPLPRGRCR